MGGAAQMGWRKEKCDNGGRRICEKTLKNRHFLKKKRRKKEAVGLVFLLRLYYNVVSSGEKWLKREQKLRIGIVKGERW